MSRSPRSRKPFRPLFATCIAGFVGVLAVATNGCGNGRTAVQPVDGKVNVDGKPAKGVELVFHALSELPPKTPTPHATTAADGTFRLSTYLSDDGAPAGEYAVTATWPAVKVEGGEEIQGPDRLSGRYREVAKPMAKVKLERGSTSLPVFEATTR